DQRLDAANGKAEAAAFLLQIEEVFFADRRSGRDDAERLVALLVAPIGDQSRLVADIAIAEAEAIIAVELVRAGPRDQRHLPRVAMFRERNGAVGVVGADDHDAAGVAEAVVAVDPAFRRVLREARIFLDDDLVAAVDDAFLDRLVEDHANFLHEV